MDSFNYTCDYCGASNDFIQEYNCCSLKSNNQLSLDELAKIGYDYSFHKYAMIRLFRWAKESLRLIGPKRLFMEGTLKTAQKCRQDAKAHQSLMIIAREKLKIYLK